MSWKEVSARAFARPTGTRCPPRSSLPGRTRRESSRCAPRRAAAALLPAADAPPRPIDRDPWAALPKDPAARPVDDRRRGPAATRRARPRDRPAAVVAPAPREARTARLARPGSSARTEATSSAVEPYPCSRTRAVRPVPTSSVRSPDARFTCTSGGIAGWSRTARSRGAIIARRRAPSATPPGPRAPLEAHLEVQAGPAEARAAHRAHHLARRHLLAGLHPRLAEVGVERVVLAAVVHAPP